MPRLQKTNSQQRPTLRVRWQTVAGLLLAAAFFYVVVPRFKTFHQSFTVLHHAQPVWLLIALAAAIGTYVAAAGTYWVLAKHPIRYGQTVVVQMAGTFVNRILPGGVGALSVNYQYLRKRQHTTVEAGSVIALNNLLGLLGNGLLLLGALVLVPTHLKTFSLPHLQLAYVILGAAIILIIATVLWSRKLRGDVYRTAVGVQRNIFNYRAQPLRLVGGLGTSMVLTIVYTWCLAACAQALGVHLAVAQILVIMTAGVAVGTLTPTPGGLFGAEAGLFAGFIAYGVSRPDALAIVLVYRLLTYWLALFLGAVALVFTRRLGYL